MLLGSICEFAPHHVISLTQMNAYLKIFFNNTIFTIRITEAPHCWRSWDFLRTWLRSLGFVRLGEHSVEQPKEFSTLVQLCASLTHSQQQRIHSSTLGGIRSNVLSRGKIPQLWCIVPESELQRAQSLLFASSFLSFYCGPLSTRLRCSGHLVYLLPLLKRTCFFLLE